MNQLSAELGSTKYIFESTKSQVRVQEMYAKLVDSDLDVRMDPTSGRRSLNDTYGSTRFEMVC
jgi:hypothetical protein